MITLLVGFANTASAACPDDIATATATLENVRAEHAAVRHEVRSTDWDYLTAVEADPDEVRARQERALEQLRTTRIAVRDAKRALKNAENQDPTGVVCDPDETPKPTAG